MNHSMRVMSEKPLNAETPAVYLQSWITGNAVFFKRNQGRIMSSPVALDRWRHLAGGGIHRAARTLCMAAMGISVAGIDAGPVCDPVPRHGQRRTGPAGLGPLKTTGALQLEIADAYRAKRGLLTSGEIRILMKVVETFPEE